MALSGLVAKPSLDSADTVQLHELAAACTKADGLEVKLNWSMIADRAPGRINDLCFYDNGALVGYMPLDDFGGSYEITGVVAPAHRRRGIFRAMYEAAVRELRGRGASELLLVNYRASASGCAVVARLGIPYHESEYCMEAAAEDIPPPPTTALTLERVTPENVETLSHMLKLTFDDSRWSEVAALLHELASENKRYFLARLDGEAVGQIGVIVTSDRVYIRAVGIAPQLRHRGYGRQLLAATIAMHLREGARSFELDVATDNPAALSIYTGCGFHETNVYDYYSVPLST